MGFRGQAFVFGSPAAAVAAMIARAGRAARPGERVELNESAGRILAEEVRADRDSPAFDYSAMDGYAICAADLAVPSGEGSNETVQAITLLVVGEARIGEPPPASFEGVRRPVAVRIATGAAIPAGADTVVRREDVIEHAAGRAADVTSISVTRAAAARVRRGDHIRRRGETAPAGADPFLGPA